jgi:hypothetical protein
MGSPTSPMLERSVVLGSQRPRICRVPEYGQTSGREAIELAALAGLDLDPWSGLMGGGPVMSLVL